MRLLSIVAALVVAVAWRSLSVTSLALSADRAQDVHKAASQISKEACLDNANYECIFDLAYDAALQIESPSTRSYALRELALARFNSGNEQAAQDTLLSALIAAREIPDRLLKENFTVGIARTQARIGDVRGALGVIRTIRQASLRAEAIGGVAETQAESGHLTEAMATIQEVEDTYKADAMSGIARVLAKAGQTAAAVSLAGKIEDLPERQNAFGSIAVSCPKACSFHEGFIAFQNTDLHSQYGKQALPIYLKYLLDARRYDAANKIVSRLHGSQWLVDVGRLYADAGEIDSALRIKGEVRGAVNIAQIATAIASAAARAGDHELAQKLLGEALIAAEKGGNASVNVPVFLGIAKAYALADEKESVRRVFDVALARARQAPAFLITSTLAEIALVQTELGEIEDAFSTISEALSSVPDGDWYDFSGALPRLAKALAKIGRIQAALSISRSLKESSERVRSVQEVITALAEDGDIEGALRLADELKDGDEHAEAIGSIANAQAKAGDFEGAVARALGIGDSVQRAYALMYIGDALRS